VSTQELVEKLIDLWGSGEWLQIQKPGAAKNETEYLRLNWDKAAALLGWQPVYSLEETLAEIAEWYKAYQNKDDMLEVGREQIGRYVRRAREMGLKWAQ
jgi:CDP-glucose 4,6-dehydratase